MGNIGILAYGSLIDCPGCEIEPVITERIKGVETPFKVEFARSSSGRDGAPTLVPVDEGGACVNAVILVLEESISETEAQNMLWRRETNKVCSGESYNPPSTVCIKRWEGLHTVQVVFYTWIKSNIDPLTPQKLARLAIKSAKCSAGAKRRDGISYLIAAKRNGIVTPLMPGYEQEVLRQTGTGSLEEAARQLGVPIDTERRGDRTCDGS